MWRDSCWLTPDFNAHIAVACFLNDFTGRDRVDAIHLVLTQLRFRMEPDRVLACELAWEIHAGAYWSQLQDSRGHPYESEEAYFREVLGLSSWRTAYKRLAIGRMLMQFPESQRPLVRAAIADVGLAKATVIAPAIERSGEWATWVELAKRLPTHALQLRISEAFQAHPRGYEPLSSGERFRRSVLGAMPDIEAMELVTRFFELGARIVATGDAVGIFLAGCRECLADWEVYAATRRAPRDSAHVGKPESSEGYPRGQTDQAPIC